MANLSFPSNPVNGQVYKAPSGVRYQYVSESKTWSTTITAESGLYGSNPGSNPPLDPNHGTLWLDTDSNTLYSWVQVGATGSWIAVTSSGGTTSSDASGLALEGHAVYDGNVLTDIGINLEVQPAT